MDKIINIAYPIITELFGPSAAVPLWAWLGVLGMIFWGLLVNSRQDG